ncbi:MAG: primosomal protein N' [Deltaproteobacteria bacterium]|nr:MAG: primosomal protein N' [Deltaproteobacteria bacterium]
MTGSPSAGTGAAEPPRPRVQLALALPVRDSFTYAVPAGMELSLGHAVLAPFGRQRVTGYVIGPGDPSVPEARLKAVTRLLDPVPAFDAEQLRFLQWIARYYQSGLGEVIATALPAGMKARSRRVALPTEAGIQLLAQPGLVEEERLLVLREVVARPGLTAGGLARRLHEELSADQVKRQLDALVADGLVQLNDREVRGPRARLKLVRRLPDAPLPRRMGPQMRAVLDLLDDESGALPLPRLVERLGSGIRPVVRRLQDRGVVEVVEVEDRRALALRRAREPDVAPPLNPAQQRAVDAITAALSSPRPTPLLLHGVTGSGKTEVYLQAAATALARQRQVLLLVPEISLTPQLTGRVRARFGDAVAVLHSGLTAAGRQQQWQRIRAGEARLAVGARSALFAPFRELGLIIVDEEHDDSYKQDEGVRYHARDCAVVRGQMAGCPVVLGTATPSLESWHNARLGRYRHLRLPTRATARSVPRVELVDQRGRPPDEVLSPELAAAIEETLAAGGKAIVLFNRRGYAPVVECPGCGGHYACPSCGVGLVHHRGRAPRMLCHYCGYSQPFQPACPSCGTDVEILGHGTARVEEVLAEAFPEAGLLRMDADTTRGAGRHQELLDRFRDGAARILVGTQMVAKGHDFPDVHLAAVVGVDHLLMLPDFRSAERVHALVTQLAGRAGRGEVAGRVLVQTRQPDHDVFRHLTDAPHLPPDIDPGPFPLDPGMDAFLVAEHARRRRLAHPPWIALVLLRVEGTDRDATRNAARDLVDALPHAPGVQVKGPIAAPLSRLVGRWRFQVVVRGGSRAALQQWLARAGPTLSRSPRRGIRLRIDVDPRSLL